MGELNLFEEPKTGSKYFVSLDSNGGIRCVDLIWNKMEDNYYIIHRITYKYHCKHTEQPDIEIDDRGLERSAYVRTINRFNSLAKEYADKGYKGVTKPGDLYDLQDLKDIVGEYKTDALGFVKPMLCKMAKNVTNKKTFDLEYYASRKLDGLRCLMYFDNGKIHTKLRTASINKKNEVLNLDFPLKHIINHPKLISLFKKYPKLILDGEVYHHGMPLNKISGLCRSQKTAYDTDILEYYVYDIVDLDLPFVDRLKKLKSIKNELKLDSFNPYKIYKDDELHIQMVPHVKISGWDNIEQLHNEYVKEGWEGLVIRLADGKYQPGKRNNAMIKVKMYNEDTFKCIGIEQGLRLYDDMVFIMVTKSGKQFKAKPLGDHEQKVEYTKNFEKSYKGKLGDCKYFNISQYGIPTQPAFIAFRFDLTDDDLTV